MCGRDKITNVSFLDIFSLILSLSFVLDIFHEVKSKRKQKKEVSACKIYWIFMLFHHKVLHGHAKSYSWLAPSPVGGSSIPNIFYQKKRKILHVSNPTISMNCHSLAFLQLDIVTILKSHN